MPKNKRLGKGARAIELLREKMIKLGKEKGLDHPDTVSISQELDKLINKAMIVGGR